MGRHRMADTRAGGRAEVMSLPTLAISIRQAWAWLVVNGHKRYENRDWTKGYPARNVRGKVLIHASQGMTLAEYKEAERVADGYKIALPPMHLLQRGGIVGMVEVLRWHDTPPAMPFAFRSGLELTGGTPLPFVPCPGRLGYFSVGPAVLKALASAEISTGAAEDSLPAVEQRKLF